MSNVNRSGNSAPQNQYLAQRKVSRGFQPLPFYAPFYAVDELFWQHVARFLATHLATTEVNVADSGQGQI